jgi:hypothetical protein
LGAACALAVSNSPTRTYSLMNSIDRILSGSIQAYGRILCIIMHKRLPGAKIIPGTTHHGALMHHRKRRYPPLPKSDRRALVAGT